MSKIARAIQLALILFDEFRRFRCPMLVRFQYPFKKDA